MNANRLATLAVMAMSAVIVIFVLVAIAGWVAPVLSGLSGAWR